MCQAERGAHAAQVSSLTGGNGKGPLQARQQRRGMGGSLLPAAPPRTQPASVSLSAVLMSVTPSSEAFWITEAASSSSLGPLSPGAKPATNTVVIGACMKPAYA